MRFLNSLMVVLATVNSATDLMNSHLKAADYHPAWGCFVWAGVAAFSLYDLVRRTQ